jgi:drug/metabolite transporter (DMT)-like permease
MILAALFFSLMAVLVKLACRRLPSMEVVLARSLLSASLSFMLLLRARAPLLGQRRRLLVARGAVGSIALALYFYAIAHLKLADAVTIQYTHPILVAIFAPLFLGEPSSRRLWGVVGIAFLGMLLIVKPEADVSLWAGIAAVGSAFGAAAAYALVRALSTTEHPLTIVFYFPCISSLISLPFVVADFVMPRGVEWVALAGVALATTIAQLFLTWGLKLEPAARATSVSYWAILFGALLGWLLFGETLDRLTIAGGVLIIGATALLSRSPGITPGTPPHGPSGGRQPHGIPTGQKGLPLI